MFVLIIFLLKKLGKLNLMHKMHFAFADNFIENVFTLTVTINLREQHYNIYFLI